MSKSVKAFADLTLVNIVQPSIILVSILIFLYSKIYAQASQRSGNNTAASLLTSFNNPTIFTLEDGYRLKSASAIAKDNNGFLWIGGQGGLLRFDGSTFKQIPLCVEGTEQHWVRDLLFEEEKQVLWIATWGYGLLQLNLATYECKTVYNGDSYPDKYLYWLHQEPDALWIGKSRGMSALLFDRDTLLDFTYTAEPNEQNIGKIDRSRNFQSHWKDIHDDSILWIGTLSGLLKFNFLTHDFQLYYYDFAAGENRGLNSIPTIYQHRNGNLFLGTWGGGIVRFDPGTAIFSRPSNRAPDKQHDIIVQISPRGSDLLWLSTNHGIQELDPISLQLKDNLEHDLKEDLIYRCQFVDDAGRIYYGYRDLFFIIDPIRQQFSTYPSSQLEFPNNERPIKGLFQSNVDNKVWLMFFREDSMYLYDLITGSWETKDFPDRSLFSPLHQYCLSDGRYVVLGVENDYFEFSPETAELQAGEIWPDPAVKANAFLEHSDGSHWFSTQSHGMIRWKDGTPTRYLSEFSDPSYPEHYHSLGTMIEDSLKNVWINSLTGYSVYHYQKDTFYNFPFLLSDTSDHVDLANIVSDRSGGIWLLSFRHGLMKVDPEHPEQGVKFRYRDLKHPVEYAGPVDQAGRIWLYSALGLEYFDPQRLESRVIENVYGIPEEITAFDILKDGRLYLAYRGGFQFFHPDSISQNQHSPTPYISGFKVFDRPYDTNSPIYLQGDVSLGPGQNFFSIQFSGINFSLPEQDSFAYQLENIDPNWVYTRDRREVFYTNIPSGTYRFKLKAANSEGIWSQEMASLKIHIATPWWRTFWAMGLYSILLGYLVILFYRFQLSHRLAMAEGDRLRELNEWKGKFYTNITHEFRTPLTVILGMTETIQKALNSNEPAKTLRATKLIKRNGEQLLKLVNDMLELAKMDQGKLQLKTKQIDVIALSKYLAENYLSLAQAREINFSIQTEIETLIMDLDHEKFTVILSNLIMNAIKFTGENGVVKVHLDTAEMDGKLFFKFQVEDTGPGLTAIECKEVFDRFYQSPLTDPSYPGGTGIGLALTKELVQFMGGYIGVDSHPGKGSTFWVQLPIHREALLQEAPLISTKRMADPEVMKETNLEPHEHSVLIIEDSPDVTVYLQDCLEDQYQVISAPDGKRGVQLALDIIPDLIISDVMMPEMDGFAVCEKLKTHILTNHIPIVLLTARAMSRDRVTGIRHGADAYLTKPFNKEELLVRLDQLLTLRATLQKKYSSTLSGDKREELGLADPKDAFIVKVESIVRDHLDDESFSGDALARELYLSPSQVYRKIKALTNMSTAVYIRHVRLQHAKELLFEPTLSISEVAYRTGFTPVYFSQAFKDAFGISPSSFRSKN